MALAAAVGATAQAVAWEARDDALGEAALVVNTSALGMTGHPALDLDVGRLAKTAIVNDIVAMKGHIISTSERRRALSSSSSFRTTMPGAMGCVQAAWKRPFTNTVQTRQLP